MSISKKKFKTKVYFHSGKKGEIAIRVIGKYLYDFGFNDGDVVLVDLARNKIILTNTKIV